MSEKIYDAIDLETIERLADIVNAKELSEITLVCGDNEITIKGKRVPPPPRGPGMPPMPPMGIQQPAPAEAVPQERPAPRKVVKAPIVGTFYAASSPESAPFVQVGDVVHKGDTVFIIESMKVMSEVQSELEGVVKEICVSNGDPVEFDQPVIILE